MRKIMLGLSLCALLCCGYLTQKRDCTRLKDILPDRKITVTIEGAVAKPGDYVFEKISNDRGFNRFTNDWRFVFCNVFTES